MTNNNRLAACGEQPLLSAGRRLLGIVGIGTGRGVVGPIRSSRACWDRPACVAGVVVVCCALVALTFFFLWWLLFNFSYVNTFPGLTGRRRRRREQEEQVRWVACISNSLK